MKKLISMVLTAVLCSSILVAAPLAVCYADEPSSGEGTSSSSSTTTGEETDKPEPTNPIAPQDAQLPGDEMA